jgi:hypothetical protein
MRHWIREILVILAVVFPIVFIAASYVEDLVETGSQEGSGEIAALITGCRHA